MRGNGSRESSLVVARLWVSKTAFCHQNFLIMLCAAATSLALLWFGKLGSQRVCGICEFGRLSTRCLRRSESAALASSAPHIRREDRARAIFLSSNDQNIGLMFPQPYRPFGSRSNRLLVKQFCRVLTENSCMMFSKLRSHSTEDRDSKAWGQPCCISRKPVRSANASYSENRSRHHVLVKSIAEKRKIRAFRIGERFAATATPISTRRRFNRCAFVRLACRPTGRQAGDCFLDLVAFCTRI